MVTWGSNTSIVAAEPLAPGGQYSSALLSNSGYESTEITASFDTSGDGIIEILRQIDGQLKEAEIVTKSWVAPNGQSLMSSIVPGRQFSGFIVRVTNLSDAAATLDLWYRQGESDSGGGGGGINQIQDEGVDLPQRSAVNFAGAGVTATDTGTNTLVTIPGCGGTPGGADTQVQFNNGGAFGGSSLFTFDTTNNKVNVKTTFVGSNIDVTNSLSIGKLDNRFASQFSEVAIGSGAANRTPLVLYGETGQTAPLLILADRFGNQRFAIGNTGTINSDASIGSSSEFRLTGAVPQYTLSKVGNDAVFSNISNAFGPAWTALNSNGFLRIHWGIDLAPGASIRPSADSTTAIRFQNAASTTTPLTIDTTNNIVTASGVTIRSGPTNSIYLAGAPNATGIRNTVLGSLALNSATTSIGCTVFGVGAAQSYTGSGDIVSFGRNCSLNNVSGIQWTSIGTNAALNALGSSFVAIGMETLLGNTNASSTIAVGYRAGNATGSAVFGVYLGRRAGESDTDSNKLHIANDDAKSLLHGNFSSNCLGIGETTRTTPTAAADLAASTTARASLRIRTGVAPTSPNDGDIWSNGTDLHIRLGGATYTLNKTAV